MRTYRCQLGGDTTTTTRSPTRTPTSSGTTSAMGSILLLLLHLNSPTSGRPRVIHYGARRERAGRSRRRRTTKPPPRLSGTSWWATRARAPAEISSGGWRRPSVVATTSNLRVVLSASLTGPLQVCGRPRQGAGQVENLQPSDGAGGVGRPEPGPESEPAVKQEMFSSGETCQVRLFNIYIKI